MSLYLYTSFWNHGTIHHLMQGTQLAGGYMYREMAQPFYVILTYSK